MAAGPCLPPHLGGGGAAEVTEVPGLSAAGPALPGQAAAKSTEVPDIMGGYAAGERVRTHSLKTASMNGVDGLIVGPGKDGRIVVQLTGMGEKALRPDNLEPLPEDFRLPHDQMTTDAIRARLIELYEKYRPEQVQNIDLLLLKFEGREAEVLKKAEEMFVNPAKRQRTEGGAGPKSEDQMRRVAGLSETRFEVITIGDGGKMLKHGDRAVIHGFGSVLGTKRQFWNTHEQEKPFAFDVGKGDLVRGLDVGCIGMRVGECRRFIVRPADGYGTSGFALFNIDGNEVLQYIISLVQIEQGADMGV